MTPLSRILVSIGCLAMAQAATAQLQCFVNAAGESCGPQITVTFTPNGQGGNYTMDMVGTGLHPSSFAGFSWGLNPQSIPLPGGCRILTDYVWGHYGQSDATGSFSWSRSWPHWATIAFYMQMGSFEVLPNGSLSILTTNAKYAGCL